MKVKIEGGELKIDLLALVESLPKDGRNNLARFLVADEMLWRAVLDCVSDDSKYAGHYFRDDADGEWWFTHETVMELREKLIPIMPEVARLAVEEALRQRNQAIADKERSDRWAWKLFHSWPDGEWMRRPAGPEGWERGEREVSADASAIFAEAARRPGHEECRHATLVNTSGGGCECAVCGHVVVGAALCEGE